MKNILLTSALIVGLFLTYSCGGNTQKKGQLSFEEVGYFKSDSKLRYFTFYVKSDSLINLDSISEKVYDEIKDHGSNQMNTSGVATASFYYFNKEQTPDISLLSAQAANEKAHNRKPIAAVWILPTGKINLIKNPE